MDTGKLLDKAKDATQEFFEQNDTSVDAKLLLNGTEYEIETFNTQFQKACDYKGEPQCEVKGGLMRIKINHVADEQINNWMFNPGVKYSGSITFASFSRIASPVIVIRFTNGRCAEYTKNIGNSTVSYSILISAEKVNINGLDHENNSD